jgi:hypothetical protein
MIRRLTRGVYAPLHVAGAAVASPLRGIADGALPTTIRALFTQRWEMRIMMRHWILRLSFLAMLLLAAGAGKKWQ